MRALKVLAELLKWRWTPTVALLASSLLYVLIALLVVPQTIAVPDESSPKSVNIVNAMDRKGPRPGQPDDESPPGAPAPGRPQITTPPPPTVIAAPPPPPAPAPPPPAEEPRREEPPAPPPPPPAQPTPAPEEEEGRAAPPNRSRFAASPMRVLPTIAAQVQAAAPPAPEPPAPPPEEE